VVASPEDRDLFALRLVRADGTSETLAGSAAKQSTASLQEIDGGRAIVMEWSGFPGDQVAVRATARCAADEPLVLWSIEVRDEAKRRIASVVFPRVTAVPQIGQPEDDFLVLPDLPGTRIDAPAKSWPPGYRVRLDYPGSLSAQFLAYQDRAAGVYLGSMDAAGRPLALGVAKRPDGFAMWHEYTPLGEPDATWTSPYPVVLGVTQGTWCDSADQYKRWAVRQPWCAKTLVQREDVPAWWKEGPDVHVCEVRTYGKDRVCNGSYYPRLVDHLKTFREKIDGPVVPMLAGWENHRRWTAGDSFPLFDETQAKTVLAELRRDGFRPFFFLSGLFYTFENEGVDASPIPAAQQYLDHYVVDKKTGEPKKYPLDESHPGGKWRRHSYQFCVGDPATKEFFCKVIDMAHAVGVDVLQMDQTVSGGGDACYSARHGHPPGEGLYQTEAFRDLLQTMRTHGRKNSLDFVLFHEEPHEQLIPCLDGFHVREYYEKRWYRSHPGAVGIPLFCYLYHEYAIGYGGDSAGLNPSEDPRLVRTHAVNLVTGRTPGGAIWSSHRSMFDAHPNQIQILRNHSRLLRTRARDFLMLGKMLHPYELGVPKVRFVWEGDRPGNAQAVEDPAILTSSWQSPSGEVGHLFVNISGERQRLDVSLDTRNAPGWPSCDVEAYSSAAGEEFRPLWQRVSLPRRFDREMAPLEIVFVLVRESREGPTSE